MDMFEKGMAAAERHMGKSDPLEFFKRAAEAVEYAAAADVTGPAAETRPDHMTYWAGAATYAAGRVGDPLVTARANELAAMAARAYRGE